MSDVTRLLRDYARNVTDIAVLAKSEADAHNFTGAERSAFVEHYITQRLNALAVEMRSIAELYRGHEERAA